MVVILWSWMMQARVMGLKSFGLNHSSLAYNCKIESIFEGHNRLEVLLCKGSLRYIAPIKYRGYKFVISGLRVKVFLLISDNLKV